MNPTKKIICLTPVYNDWESFSILCNNIETQYQSLPGFEVAVIAVNDGSSDAFDLDFKSTLPIEIVSLKSNVGHQRAIAIGLQYVNAEKKDFDFVVVLDSDGEDRPEHIPELVAKCQDSNSKKIIFAQRKKRQESAGFKIGYFLYRCSFYLLTGQKISFGNFSCIPQGLLQRVVLQDNLWNHYSGSIIQSRTPFDKVFLDRGKRYAGQSKMRFTNLVLHGLSSMSVYFDTLSVRILKLSMLGILVCLLAVGVVLYVKIFTDASIPGWASNLILIIFTIILQLFSVTLIVLLMQLSARKNVKSPSDTIYKDFIESKIQTSV
jgi:glycosyltransferase involved in cell wall biosynthesis